MDILAFCQKRGIAAENIRITQSVQWGREPTDQSHIVLQVNLPPDFPVKYEKAIGKAVDKCLVAQLGRCVGQSSFERRVSRGDM